MPVSRPRKRIPKSKPFWCTGSQASITVNNAASDVALLSVTVSGLPSYANIDRVRAIFKYRKVENTNAAGNKLNGAQEIQVKETVAGSWTDAINFLDDDIQVDGSTTDGGDVVMGNVDVKGEVTGNGTYDLQWDEASVDSDSLVFYSVQVGLVVEWTE